jgi:hypothetical protein
MRSRKVEEEEKEKKLSLFDLSCHILLQREYYNLACANKYSIFALFFTMKKSFSIMAYSLS